MAQQPNYAFRLPWFMFDLRNRQLITTPVIPGDIRDQKEIVLSEQPIPGLNYRPVTTGGAGNRRISFTLPLIRRNNTVGNVLLLKQIDQLRNQQGRLFGPPATGQFGAYPKVLYYWGIGSVPLVWFVKRADASHKQGWVNALGQPQYSEIEFELILDETDPTFKAETQFRQVSALLGEALAAFDVTGSVFNRKPY